MGNQKMDSSRVPTGTSGLDEMIEGGFPRGSLIIVAGNPGSGKTVFGTQFLCKGAHSGEPVVFASFGEGKDAFIANTSKHFHCNAEECIRNGKIAFLDMAALREGGAPTVLQTLLDRVERVGAKRLLIDSFSAMALGFERKLDTRMILQTILVKVVKQLGCTTILTDEVPFGQEYIGTGVEEFVADGVIKLGSEIIEDRPLRVIEIEKLRGTRLPNRKLIFTLEDGFKVFPPFQIKPIEKPQRFRPLPDIPGKFSTGSEELDRVTGGGYPTGSTVLFEMDRGVPDSQAQLILGQTVRNFMFNGRAGIMIPSARVDIKMMKLAAMRVGLTEDEVNRYLRICLLHFSGTDSDPIVVPLKGQDIEQDGRRIIDIEEERMKETGRPVVVVGGYDSGIATYGIEAMMKTAVIDAARARDNGNLNIVVLRAGYGTDSLTIGEMADQHFKLVERYGALILYGIKPRTNLLIMEMDTSKGYPAPKLTPMV
jgi:KaiC/GvpD/RAD55 family RecA-like ATPase